MEYTLRAGDITKYGSRIEVLILVLMEYTLRENFVLSLGIKKDCLNPCFNGIYSQSDHTLEVCALLDRS